MKSIWSVNTQLPHREPLTGTVHCEAAVIGGGMAGILCAYELEKAGIRTIVLEADRIASGQTKNTTAKITLQHGPIYHRLIESVGLQAAMQYVHANKRAIAEYKRMVYDENIDCDFQILPSYLYTKRKISVLNAEYKAAKQLSIDCEMTRKTQLPFEIKAALRFADQAQFDPLRFIKAVSGGLKIYEKTPVQSIEQNRLITKAGTVYADQIFVCTHFPFINFPGLYFAKMHQQRSYVVAIKTDTPLDGMYYGIDTGALSFRGYQDYILLGGGSHRTGESDENAFRMLREEAGRLYGQKPRFYWAAQDCMSLDGVPYIGQYAKKWKNIYVATGFNKWGMTSAMAAALLLADMAQGKNTDAAAAFDPARINAPSAKAFFAEAGHSVKGLTAYYLKNPDGVLSNIPKGWGGIIDDNGHKTGVYKDKTGKIYAVIPKCPHLGCQLSFNHAEKTWDCPCHGSRFDYQGRLIDNPAQENLKRL